MQVRGTFPQLSDNTKKTIIGATIKVRNKGIRPVGVAKLASQKPLRPLKPSRGVLRAAKPVRRAFTPTERLPSATTSLTPRKARTILEDKTVRGRPITPKQRGFFGAVSRKPAQFNAGPPSIAGRRAISRSRVSGAF